jgi:hypothetical protein
MRARVEKELARRPELERPEPKPSLLPLPWGPSRWPATVVREVPRFPEGTDREVVLAAVGQDGSALAYASQELRNDREVVLAAVRQDGRARVFASDVLRNDRDVGLEAVR